MASDCKNWSKTVRWFGDKLHLVAGTCYESPFDFRVGTASVSKTYVCRKMTVAILSGPEAVLTVS